jgi:AcrR family transcriptional regulator
VDRTRQILDTAAEAFYDKGFHAVGVDELGTRAGLSGPAIYRTFSSKHEILATLLNEAMDGLLAAAVPVHEDPRTDLDRALRHHVDFALHARHLVNLYQREVRSLPEPWKTPFDQRRAEYTARWETLISRRVPALDPGSVAALTQSCLGVVFSVSYWPGHALSAADAAGVVHRMIISGVAAFDTPG